MVSWQEVDLGYNTGGVAQKISIAMRIAIEKSIRINQDPIFLCKTDRDFSKKNQGPVEKN